MKYKNGNPICRNWRVPYSRKSLRKEIAACRERLQIIREARSKGLDVTIDKHEEDRLINSVYRCRMSAIKHYCFRKPKEKIAWTRENWTRELEEIRSRRQ